MFLSRIDDRWVRWLLVPAIVFISQATNDAYLADFWHHLARGQYILQTGELLNHDIYSFTVTGTPFVDVNWVSQMIFASLYNLGGLGLVRTMNALTLAAAFAWLVAICQRESGSLEVAMAVGLAVFFGTWQVLTIRPQTISILLFVGLYDVLIRAETDRRWLWATPVFLAVWANVHGAFPAGIMLVGAFAGGRVFSRLTGAASGLPLSGLVAWGMAVLVCAAATLVNPYGVEIYRYAAATSGIAARREIDEWLPPSLDQMSGIAFFVSVVVAFIVIAWSRRVSWREALLLVLFFVMAIGSIRMVLWWLIAIGPMIASRLADFMPASKSVTYEPTAAASRTVLVLLACCVISLPPLHSYNPLLRLRRANEETMNLGKAYDLIASKNPMGAIFSKLEWGEYLGWRGHDNWNRVFMDGRIEIYPDTVWDEYKAITTGKKQPPAEFAVLDARFHGRVGLLAMIEAFDFRKIGEFGDVIVYERESGQ